MTTTGIERLITRQAEKLQEAITYNAQVLRNYADEMEQMEYFSGQPMTSVNPVIEREKLRAMVNMAQEAMYAFGIDPDEIEVVVQRALAAGKAAK